SETVGGVKVFSLPATGLPTNAPVHYARSGSAFAVGLDRKLVAASVTPDAAAAVTGGDNPVSLPADPVAFFGTLTVGDVITAVIERPRPEGPVVPVEGGTENRFLPNGQPIPEKFVEEQKKARKDFLAALGSLSPATVTARRVGNELRIEVYQPKVQNGGLKALIDAGTNWLDKAGDLHDPNRIDRFRGDIYGK